MKIFNKVSTAVLFGSFVLTSVGITSVIAAGPVAVNLGTAGNFTILSKTGISTTGVTSVVGDIGVSPAAATYITGFSLNLSAGSAYSTSPLVAGKVYAPGYADPTPANISTAVSNMETAYTDAQGRTNPTSTELGAGNIGGMTLAPGLYKWSTGVTIPTDVTLSGSANDVWIFQIAQNLDISSAKKVILSGGAQANNIFWAVAGQVTIGTNAEMSGNILGQTAIVLNTGAVLRGRALAQSAVTLDSSSVIVPVATTASVVTTPAPVTTSVTANTTSYSGSSSYTPAAQVATAVDAVNDSGCAFGNKFSTVTGRSCVSVAATSNMASANDAGCVSGNKFSTVTGKNCGSQASVSSSNFGQQVRAITSNLFKGLRNNNVKNLQEFLISQNKGPAAETLASASATSYYGELTRAALAEFQASVGISPASGFFGPITRSYISSH